MSKQNFYRTSQGFPNGVKVWGNPPKGRRIETFVEGVLLPGGGNLRSDFDHGNLFQRTKQLSVNTEQQLKSKLA